MLALAAEHGGNPDDPNKRHPLDFVLWQPSLPDEPSWESRWGPGRPGWHIECSALALRELGETVDVHGGGRDLVFPHHECETAQSESVTGTRFVRHWLHVGLVGLDGTKMSKSLGNLVFVGDLLKEWEPAVVRLALLSHHYRPDWEWSDADLARAAARLAAWRAAGEAAPVPTRTGSLWCAPPSTTTSTPRPPSPPSTTRRPPAARSSVGQRCWALPCRTVPIGSAQRPARSAVGVPHVRPAGHRRFRRRRKAHQWQPSPSDSPMARPRSSRRAPRRSSSPPRSARAWPRRRSPPPSTASRWTCRPSCPTAPR